MKHKTTHVSTCGRLGEVSRAFLWLGLTSFGGPIAHIGYFRHAFVTKRKWLSETQYSQLIALCQFLPGPASSQIGFSIGLIRGGWMGALAAFACFTLPSALLMFAFATMSHHMVGSWGQSVIHGLKLVAVVVVAQGVYGMARNFLLNRGYLLIAVVAAILALFGGSWMQLLIIAMGATLGLALPRAEANPHFESLPLGYGRRTGTILLTIPIGLLGAAIVLIPYLPPTGQSAAAFYRTGALVFGGGHVVLPLLKQAVVNPGWISEDNFLAGYGAAQAVPGPMFTLAAFLGAQLHNGTDGALGALVCVLAIFLPGLLMVAGALPFWQALSQRNGAIQMLTGVNAAVVGLLAAALYNPVWVSAIHGGADIVIAFIGVALLIGARWPSLAIVLWCVCAAILQSIWLRP